MNHELKCWPEYFQAVKSGAKTFEVRKWDRPYQVGDMLRLREYDPKKLEYTGDEVIREVTYLLDMTYLPGDNIPHFAGKVVLGLADPRIASLHAEVERLRAALETIKGTAEAMGDGISTVGAMRFSMRGIGKAARAALEKEDTNAD